MSDSRDKMVQSAAALIGERGMNATSFSDVLADSGAPRGSIYHHFPDGKRQLTQCAMRLTSDQILEHMRSSSADTPDGVLAHFLALFHHVVVASHARAGCTIAGVTIDVADDEDDLLAVAKEAFSSWVSLLSEQLTHVGVEKKKARATAVTVIASVEGALILCRADGSVEPLTMIEEQLVLLLAR